MSFTHTITKSWTNGGAPISKAIETEAGAEVNIDETIPDSSTDLEVGCDIDVSALKSLFIVSDQDITVCTNDDSEGSPADTISLKADQPLIWNAADGYFTNPLGTDVTALFVTNASGSSATLRLRALLDPTP